MRCLYRSGLKLCLGLGFVTVLNANSAWANDPDMMSVADRRSVIAQIGTLLSQDYIYPDRAEDIADGLVSAMAEKSWGEEIAKSEFAQFLSKQLVEDTNDLHFFVGVDPDWISKTRDDESDSGREALAEEALNESRASNFGLKSARILRGNIGYIRFDYFDDPEIAALTMEAALRMTTYADALIFDLRYNNGGVLEMAQLIMSYLFSADDPVPLFLYEYTKDGVRTERGQWVLPSVAGARIVDTPVYVLTSNTTFSSAEWFASVLQSYGRATVIGGRTAGGAHPVTRKPINADFFLQMPFGKIVNPVTKGDFEGRGVEPDIEVASLDALETAHRLALERVSTGDEEKQSELDWLQAYLSADYAPMPLSETATERLTGQYEGRRIDRVGDRLIYRWRDRFAVALLPISDTEFVVEGVESFRFKLSPGEDGAMGLERIDKDGMTTLYKKLGD